MPDTKQREQDAGPVVLCDVGDVLIRTVPDAQYRELARRTGTPRTNIAQLVRAAGIDVALERGELSVRDFTEALRRLLNYPALSVSDVRECWLEVLAGAEPTLVPVAARLAAAGRLVLASNTNALHWPKVRGELRREGLHAPAYLSFRLGYVKPDRRFFEAILANRPDLLAHGVIFIDNRQDNVAAATTCGIPGWPHRTATATAAFLSQVADGAYAHPAPATAARPPAQHARLGSPGWGSDREECSAHIGVRCPSQP